MVVTVEKLETIKKAIESGFNCGCESITEEGLSVTPEAVEWLKEHHYQIKVTETFGPTGIAALVYPA